MGNRRVDASTTSRGGIETVRWRTVLSTRHHGAPEEQERPTVIGVGRGVDRDRGAREGETGPSERGRARRGRREGEAFWGLDGAAGE